MKKEIQTDADWQTERARLDAEIRRLEAALVEAKEVTRVKVTEEVEDEFAGKLRDSKRLRAKLEEEFEEASERWRSERRRLNSEIDQLEKYAQKARGEALRARSSGESDTTLQTQLAETEQRRQQAERELREATTRWEPEREALQGKVSRLESQVVEALQRSANPPRSTDALASKYQAEMETRGHQVETESAEKLKKAEEEWDRERGRLHLEISRLKKSGGVAQAAGPATPSLDQQEEIDRLQAGQKALQVERDALGKQVAELESGIAAEAARLEAAQEQLAAEQQRWDAGREDMNEKLKHLEESLSASDSKIDASGALRTELEEKIEALEASRSETLERMAEWDRERQRMGATIEEMNHKLAEGESRIDRAELEALREELLAQLGESKRQKTALEEKVTSVTREWAEEKASFESKLSDVRETAQSDREGVESELREKLTLEYEQVAELEFEIAGEADRLQAAHEQLEVQQQRWDAERAGMNEKLKQLEKSLSADESKIDASELTALRAELEEKIEAAAESRSEAWFCPPGMAHF